MTLPSLFLSHGAPTLPLTDTPARAFLSNLGRSLERPKAILVVSAHWETETPAVNAVERNETIHDFGGFPRALYDLKYPAPGAPALAAEIAKTLREAGFPCAIDTKRGLDHGAWVPLMLMYPEADLPVVQLSIQSHLGPEHHLKLGQALAALRDENILVLGSGGYTHNLRALDRWRLDGPERPWVGEFSDWIGAALTEGRTGDVTAYRRLAPHAAEAHPEEDHFMPLFVALGAGGEGARATRLHRSITFGSLRMDAYAFS
jgi:4,5-DOPA dioxygenase extradiol